jgi:hypothetical protein
MWNGGGFVCEFNWLGMFLSRLCKFDGLLMEWGLRGSPNDDEVSSFERFIDVIMNSEYRLYPVMSYDTGNCYQCRYFVTFPNIICLADLQNPDEGRTHIRPRL